MLNWPDPTLEEPRKLSNYFLLYRFLSFVQWERSKTIKTQNQPVLKRGCGEKFELERREIRAWEVGQSVRECNLTLLKVKVKVNTA